MSSQSVYKVVHEHLKSAQLLRKRHRLLCLNDGPFRAIHCIVFIAFLYAVLTHVPPPSEAQDVSSSPLPSEALDDFDVQDGLGKTPDVTVESPELEVWEPKSPQDYVKVVWAIITIFHVLVNLFCIWMVKNHGVPDIVSLTKRRMLTPNQTENSTNSPSKQESELHVEFDFRRVRFELGSDQTSFHPVRFPDSDPIASYLGAKGFETDKQVLAAIDLWGTNTVEVPVPHFMDMLKEQMLAPFFCFQVFCVLLWCMDAYWYYSVFTLFMLVTFECTVVMSRTRTLTDLRSIQVPKQQLQVYRCGKWQKLPGEVLLPGDVISIARGGVEKRNGEEEDVVAPADVLLVSGACVADEAVLTGESTPQWKEAITAKAGGATGALRAVDARQDKRHILFGGTKLLSSSPGEKTSCGIESPDGGAIGVVLRTGFETAQGRLMRMILFSTERLTANTVETGLFICFLLIFALAAAGYVLHEGLQHPPEERSRFKLYLNCAMVITSVIPPELPMELTMAVNNSLIALRRQAIFCTEPFRIPFAGKVEVCCFDKTGTLTSDHMLLNGLVGTPDASGALNPHGSADPPDAKPENWCKEATLVMACCNSLMNIDGELVGDPLEKAAFLASGWQLLGGSGGPLAKGTFGGALVSVKHVQNFHFSSELKRMAVIVRVTNRVTDSCYVLAKGAPEVMRQRMRRCPQGYDAEYKAHASQGSRVIALAAKQLTGMTMSDIRNMSREQAESELEYMGLAVFNTPLKPGSVPALKMLADSSHQLVMITGDAPLTACYTAQQVHIIDRPVLILNCSAPPPLAGNGSQEKPTDSDFFWQSPDETVREAFSRNVSDVVDLARVYDLCITGDGLQHCSAAGVDSVVIACSQVFARVSPDQKEYIINVHKAAGRTTLMCGDGTNDVGALKAAHVGIALMEPPSEAKVAAARQAAREQLKKKQEDLRRQLQGLPPPPKRITDSDGNLLPGSQLIQKFKEQGREVPPSMKKWADWLDQQADGSGDGMPPVLKPGDASMASPFTVKAVDVGPTTDVIKQGRCTLVVTIQMFKILGLLSLSTAYSLSVLYLAGVKLGDIQATFQGLLSAGLFFFVANAKPRKTLSAARPHQSVFCVYVMFSLLLQFLVQISFIIYMYRRSYEATPLDERQGANAEFKPNLVNTVCFLVQNAVQLITFAVNYIGEPFQSTLFENTGMIVSLRLSSFALILVASGIAPQLTAAVQLVPLPPDFRSQLFAGCFGVGIITWLIERWLRTTFSAARPPRKGYMNYIHRVPAKDKII